ncbi:MAG: cyclic nucleotide-binding domain-containing protein [Hylemonella sp.]
MAIDPVIARHAAERVRAEVLPAGAAPALKLDPAIVQKIAQKVPIFAGMSQPALLATLATAEHFHVAAGQPVFREGDLGNSFYVLIAGQVQVEKRRGEQPVALTQLGPGECFGEMALVGNEVRSATVRALDEVVAMRFYRELIDGNAEAASIIYRNIARILAARLGASSLRLADLQGAAA